MIARKAPQFLTSILLISTAFADPPPINLSGTGQTVSSSFTLEAGLSIFRMTHNGSSNFAIWLKDSQGGLVALLVNEIGSFNGSKAVGIDSTGTSFLDITADGSWSVTIEQPRPSSAPATRSFSGTGQQATELFSLSSGLAIFNMSHSGSSNFAIWLMDSQGNRLDLLVNTIGSFSGSTSVQVQAGIFVLDVTADGAWSVTVLPSAAGDTLDANLVFPQFANGEVSGIKNTTRIILRNNDDFRDTGRIEFRSGDGQLVNVPIGGVSRSSTDYEIAPWGTTEITTDGTGDLMTGSIQVISDRGENSKIEGTEVFEILGSSVSVDNSSPLVSQQVYVSVSEEENTGIAMFNPSENQSVVLDLLLVDSKGFVRARNEISLSPMQQMARFVNQEELFKDFFDDNPDIFKGTLNIHSQSGTGVSIIGLLQDTTTGALIAIRTSPNALKR
ncbi:hypothetical protein MYX84_00885 [Acidobacteria bacterium AH-259-O06]|nr:hypothetical protein [Acidobacteria bacterium AH-259-O06]